MGKVKRVDSMMNYFYCTTMICCCKRCSHTNNIEVKISINSPNNIRRIIVGYIARIRIYERLKYISTVDRNLSAWDLKIFSQYTFSNKKIKILTIC